MAERVWNTLKSDHKFWLTVVLQFAATVWFAASVSADVRNLSDNQRDLRQDVKEIRTYILETRK